MQERVELIWAQNGKMDVGQFMQEHCHECYQLYYFLGGYATFVVGGKEIKVNKGDIILIPARMNHEMKPLKREILDIYEMKLFIKDKFIESHLKEFSFFSEKDGAIKNMLTYVVENWTCRTEQNEKDIECILVSILLNFFVKDLRYENKDSTHIITDNYSDVTRDILVYIEKYFAYKFSLKTLGERLNYNKNYLCSVFRKDTGFSIVDYLNFIRIRQAIVFFAFYRQDVYTTCESVGFSNISHFSRTFKEKVGVSPRDFRRAFSLVTKEERAEYFTNEMMLNYHLCSMDDAINSLGSIGIRAKEILKQAKG